MFWKLMDHEKSHQEYQKLTLFLEGHFWPTQPRSSVTHFQTAASLIYVSIANNILRTMVSLLDLESKLFESRGRINRQNRHFWAILAIFWLIYLNEEIIFLFYLCIYMLYYVWLTYLQMMRVESVEMIELWIRQYGVFRVFC